MCTCLRLDAFSSGFASVIVVLMKQEEGSLLAVILLAYMTPLLLGCCVLLCSMMWPEQGCCPQTRANYVRVAQEETKLQLSQLSPVAIGATSEPRDVKVA